MTEFLTEHWIFTCCMAFGVLVVLDAAQANFFRTLIVLFSKGNAHKADLVRKVSEK